jgi:hypothetical protein
MTQLREEVYFTKGRVIVRGKTTKCGEAKKVDYLLYSQRAAIGCYAMEHLARNPSFGPTMLMKAC